jgi:hypothetical protein
VAIVEGEAEAAGDLLELVVLDRQRAQLAKASNEFLFEAIDDGHATPHGWLCSRMEILHTFDTEVDDPRNEVRLPTELAIRERSARDEGRLSDDRGRIAGARWRRTCASDQV